MENLASTEILVEGSDSWKYAGNLGLGRRSIRAITLNNELFTMGIFSYLIYPLFIIKKRGFLTLCITKPSTES